MAGPIYEWGSWYFEPTESRLLRDGTSVPLPGKTLELLSTLLRRSPRLVTKEEILEKVWPDAAVEEGNIAFHVAALRKVLDQGENESSIETVRGKGYRFVHTVGIRQMPPTDLIDRPTFDSALAAAVAAAAPPAAAFPAPAAPTSAPQDHVQPRWRLAVVGAIAVLAIAAAAWFALRPPVPTVAVERFTIVNPAPGQENFVEGLGAYLRTYLERAGISTSADAEDRLTGEVRPIENGYRIFVQLTRASDEARLWSWTFDVSNDVDRPAPGAGPDDARSRVQGTIATRITEGLLGYFNLSGAAPVTR